MQRVMMEKRQLLDSCLLGQRQRLLICRMTEAGMALVLLGAVLRVVDQEVRVATPVGQVLQRSVGAVGEQRDLVVGRKCEARGALIDPVAERRNWMHQKMRRDAHRTDVEGVSGVPLDEFHLGRHVAQTNRKVGGIGLVCECGLQRLCGTGRPDDGEVRPRHEGRKKKRKTLDVIEVRVSDQQMGLQRLSRAERAPQLGDAGPGIDHQQVVFLVPDLDAGRVAAAAKGAAPRGGAGASRAPELDPHLAAMGWWILFSTKISSRSWSSFPCLASSWRMSSAVAGGTALLYGRSCAVNAS